MIGSLNYFDYKKLINQKNILSKHKIIEQIQPSSIDLTLSEECYEIKSSFLSPKNKVSKKIKELCLNKIDLRKKTIFEKNKTYIVRLNEKLKLQNNIIGSCNPKSSTGRLDIFCRTILNFSDEYEKIPMNYNGDLFLEITTRSFRIKFQKGDSLNQMRLAFNKNNYISDKNLYKFNKSYPIVYNNNNIPINPRIENGLKLTVDLSGKNNIDAYVAKKITPILDFNLIKKHKINDFWKKLKSINKSLIIKKNSFYILKSKEKIIIPPNMAGEMIPYDTGIGDFRAHYAGFFDPGFGFKKGAFAVLEVKTNEVPFLIEDGQTIARIRYEKLNKVSRVVYGDSIKSNYQNQVLTLSKHFV